MAQYQVKTGPIINDQAAFSPEMVAGNQPSRNRVSVGNQTQVTISQTTQVDSPFSPEMIAGNVPVRARLFVSKHTPPINIFFDIFAFESVVGNQPSTGRFLIGNQRGSTISQTTHVSAAFGPEMVAGNIPINRILIGKNQVFPINIFLPDFQFESVFGSMPLTNRASIGNQRGSIVSLPVHDPNPQSSEMWDSYLSLPIRPSLLRALQIGQPIGNANHTPAPISLDMFKGWAPDSPRLFVAPRIRLPFFDPSLPGAFSQEMVTGNIPDKNRAVIGPKIAPPFFDPSLPGASFSMEMVQGSLPEARKSKFVRFLTEFIPNLTFNVFEFEALVSQFFDKSKRFTIQKTFSLGNENHTSSPFSTEMVVGNLPQPQRKNPTHAMADQVANLSLIVFAFEAMVSQFYDKSKRFVTPKLSSNIQTPQGSTAVALGGSVTPVGSLVKQTNRSLGGTITSAGSLLKRAARAIGGAITSTGAIVKSVGRGLVGSITSSGSIVKSCGKALGGILTPTGTISRAMSRSLSGIVASSGTIRKSVGRSLSGGISFVGSLVRQLITIFRPTVAITLTLQRSCAIGCEIPKVLIVSILPRTCAEVVDLQRTVTENIRLERRLVYEMEINQ